MIALAWPFVFLCAVAVLWRGVDAVVQTMRRRTQGHETVLLAHGVSIEKVIKRVEVLEMLTGPTESRLLKAEDEVRNIRQTLPARR